MKLRMTAFFLAIILLMGGCSWPDGSYHSVTPHQEPAGILRTENLTVSNYDELLNAMEMIISKGTENSVINVINSETFQVEGSLPNASFYIRKVYPIGAYAVDSISYEIGSNAEKTVVALNITYRHSPAEIRKIRHARDNEAVQKLICEAVGDFETSLVVRAEDYKVMDVIQIVEDYAMAYPQKVMEIPQVSSEIYGTGDARVLELNFSYQTSRDSLRNMQSQVQPVFDASKLYVSGEGSESQKFSQLYAFLMERFDYKVETSMTPAYSLLHHGVGDSRAFATVYAAMCRAADLDCVVVTGTRSGEPWVWNIICQNGSYYHVDLLKSNEAGKFLKWADEDMAGYVWDYSAYPQCALPDEGHSTENEIAEEN